MRKNTLLRELAVNLASISILLAWLSGYFIGGGRYLAGILLGAIYLLLDNLSSRFWLTYIVYERAEND